MTQEGQGPAESTGIRAIAQEWSLHWRAGVVSFVGLTLGFSLWPSVASLFIEPLRREFGWSRGDFALAFNASIIVAVAAPFFGRLIDRIGARKVLLTSFPLTALGFLSLSFVSGNIYSYYALYAFTAVVGICTTGLAFSRVVTGSFRETRGITLAITKAGVSFSGAIMPPLFFVVIQHTSWRGGFVLIAALMLLVALPMCYFWVPGHVAGADDHAERPMHTADGRGIWRPKVLLLCAAVSLTYAPGIAIQQQLQPILLDKGLAPAASAATIGLFGLAGLIGTLLSGALMDRVWTPAFAALLTVGAAVGAFLIYPPHVNQELAAAAVLLIGFSQGAQVPIMAFLIARYFGLRTYSAIYGLAVFALAFLDAVFVSVVGKSYDWTGSYRTGLLICMVSLVVSAIGYCAMGPYPQPETSPTE